MAHLGYKKRVRLPDSWLEPTRTPAPSRSRRRWLLAGLIAWLGACTLAFALVNGWRPSQLQPANDPASAQSTAAHTPAPPATVAPEPTNRAAKLAAAPPLDDAAMPPKIAEASDERERAPLLPPCEPDTPKTDERGSGFSPRVGPRVPRDLTTSDFAALLDAPGARRAFRHCRRSRHPVRVTFCVTVRGVRATAASVEAEPRDRELEECVAREIADLRFPHQPERQVLRTRVVL